MTTRKTRDHTLLLSVRFDKPCSLRKASGFAQDCLMPAAEFGRGKYFPSGLLGDPTVMTVKRIHGRRRR